MTTATVVILVLLWGGVLLPGLLRDRRSSPVSTVDGFHEAMARLARCDSRTIMVSGAAGRMQVYPRPSARSLLLARRRLVLGRLATIAGATTVTGALLGGLWWAPAVVSLTALALYVATLRVMVLAARQRSKVAPLRPAVTPARVAPATRAPVEQPHVGPRERRDLASSEPLFAGARG